MSPTVDFSNAASWATIGFIVGVAFCWLFQSLSSRKRRANELARYSGELKTANARATALREELEDQVSKASYYEAQFARLFDPAEGEVPRLRYEVVAARQETENLRAKSAEAFENVKNIHREKTAALQAQLDSSRSVELAFKQDLNSMDLQVGGLADALAAAKCEIEGWSHRFAELQEEKSRSDSDVLRLTSERKDALNAAAQASWLRGEVTRLKEEMSAAALDLQASTQEKSRLAAEVDKLTRTLSGAYADLRTTIREHETAKHDLREAHDALKRSDDPANAGTREKNGGSEVARLTHDLSIACTDLRNTVREHQTTKHDLSQTQATVEKLHTVVRDQSDEIDELKSQLAEIDPEAVRKYKEALDAAKCIARHITRPA